MFKAFTDNLSSLIGAGEKSSGAENAAEKVANNESQPSPSDENKGQEDQTKDASSTSINAKPANTECHSEEKHSGTKVPPPRPNPPLTSAGSISKQDTLPENESPTSTKAATSNSGSVESPTENTAGDAVISETASQDDKNSDEGDKKDRLDETFDEVAEKAREWGSYFFNITKSAGASVTAKAKELKKAVADNTILGDFVKEQDKFVNEKKEKARAKEAAVPPWVGYNEEEQMKAQMLTLSNDKRNFLRNPPSGVQFHFDYDTCFPVAMATLAEDERLQEMRFKLVPKLVTEHDFWRNYFYRVSLIKQSTQLTSLTKMSAAAGSPTTDSNAQPDQAISEVIDKMDEQAKKSPEPSSEAAAADINDTTNDDTDAAGGADEFISDAYNLEISDEDLMREMEALRASPGVDEQEWEEQLQKELNDYEVVGDSGDIDDAALEKEIMKEMNQQSGKN